MTQEPLREAGWRSAAVVVLYAALALAAGVAFRLRRLSVRLPSPGRWVFFLAGLVGGVAVVLLFKHGATTGAFLVYVLTLILIVTAVLLMRRSSTRPAGRTGG